MAVFRAEMACSEWRAQQPHQNDLEWMGERAVPNKEGWSMDKKWKIFPVTSHHSSFVSRKSLPCSLPKLVPLPQVYQTPSRFRGAPHVWNGVSHAFPAFAHQDQLFSWHPALTPASLVTATEKDSHPNWALRLHLRSKQKWALWFCLAGRTHIWKQAVLGAACNVLCCLRCKMSSCPKQTAVPEKPSSPSHGGRVGERAERAWLPTSSN